MIIQDDVGGGKGRKQMKKKVNDDAHDAVDASAMPSVSAARNNDVISLI